MFRQANLTNRGKQQKLTNVSKDFNVLIENTPEKFRAGKIADRINIWESITSDQWISNIIGGCSIE